VSFNSSLEEIPFAVNSTDISVKFAQSSAPPSADLLFMALNVALISA
jgi:hypothetical protein